MVAAAFGADVGAAGGIGAGAEVTAVAARGGMTSASAGLEGRIMKRLPARAGSIRSAIARFGSDASFQPCPKRRSAFGGGLAGAADAFASLDDAPVGRSPVLASAPFSMPSTESTAGGRDVSGGGFNVAPAGCGMAIVGDEGRPWAALKGT